AAVQKRTSLSFTAQSLASRETRSRLVVSLLAAKPLVARSTSIRFEDGRRLGLDRNALRAKLGRGLLRVLARFVRKTCGIVDAPRFLARLGGDVRLSGADEAAGDDPPGERALLASAGLPLGTKGRARLRDLAQGLRARLDLARRQRNRSRRSAHRRARCCPAGPGPRRSAHGHARIRDGTRAIRPSGRVAPPA